VNQTLPPSLTEFGEELERAISRELLGAQPTPPHRRRTPRRRQWALLAGAAACAFATAVALLSGGVSGSSAWSAHVLRAAEIALPEPAPNAIVHVSVTQTMTPTARRYAAGSAATVDAAGWFQQGGASRWVTRETLPGGHAIWQTDSRVYDTAAHRVYAAPSIPGGHPDYTLTTTARGGTYVLRIDALRGRTVREVVSAAEAHALRTGVDQISWAIAWDRHRARLTPMVVPSARTVKNAQPPQPNETSLTFAAQLHRLLQSGRARVAGPVAIDGRPAIKIDLPGADSRLWMVYYVDPRTYTPIALDSYGFNSRKDLTRVVFHTYQRMSIKGNARLLRLPVPAGTAVDHSATDYFRHLPTTLFIW
jgi:hypothetical protein